MPTTRVEYALRADEWLDDVDVREVMQVYVSLRARRMRLAQAGAAYANGGNGGGPALVGPLVKGTPEG
jgi:hypothetical protein